MDIDKYAADAAAHIEEAESSLVSRKYDLATAHASIATAIVGLGTFEAMRPVELTVGDTEFEALRPEPVHPRTGPVPDDEDLTPREHFELVFGPVDDEKWQWLKEFALRHPVTGGRPTWVEVDEQTLDADEVAKVGRDVTAARRQTRLALVAQGYRRTRSSRDRGDGAYTEHWVGDLGEVQLVWKAKS